MHQNKTLQ